MKTLILLMAHMLSLQVFAAEVTSNTAVPARQNKYIQSGNTELGGSFTLSSNKISEGASFSPSIGYFVADHLVIGSQFSVSYYKDKVNDSSTQTYGLGPYIGFFFLESDSWVGNFTQQFSVTQRSDLSSNKTGATFVGAKYFVSQDVAFGIDAGTIYNLDSQPIQASNLQLLGKYSIYF